MPRFFVALPVFPEAWRQALAAPISRSGGPKLGAARAHKGERMRSTFIGVVVLLVAMSGCGGSAGGGSAGTLAFRAADFVESLGVVIHPSATAYEALTKEGVLTALTYAGFRHVRANPALNGALDMRNHLMTGGIRVHYTTPAPPSAPTNAQIEARVDARIADLRTNGFDASADSVEPFNEYDANPNYGPVLRYAQSYLFGRARTLLPNVKVLGPALIGNNLDVTAATVGDVGAFVDYGNVHSYFGGKAPESIYVDRQVDFAAPTGCATFAGPANVMDERLRWVATCVAPHKPIVVTEMGYHNDITSTTHKFTSEAATATYLPGAYLELFRIGVVRTYAYELLDEPGLSPTYEQHFGLFRPDGTPKPSANAMRALTSLLSDAGGNATTFPPGRLAFTAQPLSASDGPIRSMLFQKSNGTFWLALWRPTSVFDPTSGADLPATPPITVRLSLPSAATATLYPNLSVSQLGAGTPQGTASQFDLQIGPRVSLVRLVP